MSENLEGSEEEKARILPELALITSRNDIEEADVSGRRTETSLIDTQSLEASRIGATESRLSVRTGFENFLRRTGLCRCTIHECIGNHRTCRICEPRKMQRYRKLEEDYYKTEYGKTRDESEFEIINFALGGIETKSLCTLLVTNTMTAYNAVRGISAHCNISDTFRHSIVEYWVEYEAERVLDDNEFILDLRHKQITSNQRFLFCFYRDLDKYEYISDKMTYFTNRERARIKYELRMSSDDPWLIQIDDPFYYNLESSHSRSPTSYISSTVVTPEKPPKLFDELHSVEVLTETETATFSKSRGMSPENHSPPQIPGTSGAHHGTDEIKSRSSSPKKDGMEISLSQSLSGSPSVKSDNFKNVFVDVGSDEQVNPIFGGTVFVKQGRFYTIAEVQKLPNAVEKSKWLKNFLLLRDRYLYFVDEHQNMLKYYSVDDDDFQKLLARNEKNRRGKPVLKLIGHVNELELYSATRAKRFHAAPHPGTMYLRKYDSNLKKPIRLMFCPIPKTRGDEHDSDMTSTGKKLWLTAFRLAKHGTKVRECYNDFIKEKANFELTKTIMKDIKAAMDFTEGVGRLVTDPAEIEAMKYEPRNYTIDRFDRYEKFPKEALRHGPFLTQKYYHGDLSRSEAELMLLQNGIDGVWLLRDSHSRKNYLTLSYLYQARVHHKYIAAVSHYDKALGQTIYVATLDYQLAFYDVHSLLEFYRINKGSNMLCTLRTSIKNENQPDGTLPRKHSEKTARRIDQSANPSGPITLLESGSLVSARTTKIPERIPGSTEGSKSSSLKEFFSKPFQKSKEALKSKKLETKLSSPPTDLYRTYPEDYAPITLPFRPRQLMESPLSPREPSSSGIFSAPEPTSSEEVSPLSPEKPFEPEPSNLPSPVINDRLQSVYSDSPQQTQIDLPQQAGDSPTEDYAA